MQRYDMNTKNLMQKMLRFPFITARIVWRIHWNAAKLWFKGARFYTHPDKIDPGIKKLMENKMRVDIAAGRLKSSTKRNYLSGIFKSIILKRFNNIQFGHIKLTDGKEVLFLW